MAASITDTQGIVAIAAGALALVALVGCTALAISVRRLRSAQRLVLGEQGEHDVVAHAAAMQEAFAELYAYVQDAASRLDERLANVEVALRGRIAHRLLDEERSGIVLSCIHHRDQARVYGKQVRGGRGELELSPEEAEAVRLALADGAGAGAPAVDEQSA